MTLTVKISIISILIFINYVSLGQIKLTSPQERAVYQRDGSGFSKVTIAGNYQKQVDRLEYRLISASPDQTDALDWTLLKTLPLNGNFNVVVTMKQGWYRLEVRGILNGQILSGDGVVNKMGVGEVFIIAGQSNAQGVRQIDGIGAIDDRVNCYSKINDVNDGGTFNITLSEFSKLDGSTPIAPRGINPWCWGKLGDLLASRLKVPIMFFNVALEGTKSEAWAITANGGTASNPFLPGSVYKNGLPYKNMSDVLHYFVPQLGVRSVLWCQGESDNYILTNKQNVNSTTYKNNLQTVINKTRSETGKEISWVVSLTSATTPSNCSVNVCRTAPTESNVIEGQRAVINTANYNVFQGPETDGIQNPTRSEGVHFSGNGLSQLADAWNGSLNDNFFNNSKPQLPFESTDVSFVCGDNQVEVTLPSGKNNYEWSDNNTFESGKFAFQQKVVLNANANRQYYARYRDGFGNVTQVPAINFKGSNIPVASITATGATDFCDGKQVNLKANDAAIYQWSNGSNTKEIIVITSGNFSVKTINDFGCQSNFSAPTVIISKPVPPKPTITANSAIIFCADSSVVLQSSNQEASTFIWSNGTNSRTLKVSTSGNFTVKAVSSQGCVSSESNAVAITVNPLPSTPSIVPNSSTTFCADTSVVLSSSTQDAVSYRWNTGTNNRNVTIRNSGDYSVRTVDKNGCVSLSSLATKVKVNALPPAPTIASTKDTVFCQGESTILQLSVQNGSIATFLALQDGKINKYTNAQNLNVNMSGLFNGFQTDNNNCKSPLSPSIYVSVKPTPAKVTNVLRLSPYSIRVENPRANTYVWQFNGANRPDLGGTTVRINEAGRYRVTAKNVYKTLSYGDKICSSEPSDEFSFELYDDNGLSIYPNPSRGNFSIDSKVDWKNSNVEVYNLRGELIQRAFVIVFNDVQKLDLTNLPEGEYMLRIRTDNFYTITKRIIINR